MYVVAAASIATPILATAVAKIAISLPSPAVAGDVLLFFVLALVADLAPVSMDETGKSEVSIASVFVVTAAIVFGWQYAALIAATSAATALIVSRRSYSRLVFNISMYAISAAAAGLPTVAFGPIHGLHPALLTTFVFVGAALHLLLNVTIVSGPIAMSSGIAYRRVLAPGLRQGGAAFAVMAFLAALAANLWVTEAWLLVLLAGPLFTLMLYQRTALHSRIAARDARTDNLTGLGNHRAYQTALRELIADSNRTESPFSLCLIDVDNFKHVNDVYGHPAGDDVLKGLADMLATVPHAKAFRFGGDEFAVLVSLDEMSAYRELERIQLGLASKEVSSAGAVTVSVGIATYPAHADSLAELQRTADGALYWSKAHGKNRSCLYSPSFVRIYSPEELERETERNARLRAAKNLVRFVDARDASTARHSEIVSELAEAIGTELELDPETIDSLRLAGLLHDIGKIGLPDSILSAPRQLTEAEYSVVKRHSEYGHSLLEGLGVEPVDEWIFHHHEHWDGSGYPHGLSGEDIPFGSRILLVADAFEAMTADRPYRSAQTAEVALAELYANAGTQFDPNVVEAFTRYLASAPADVARIV